MSAVTQGTAGLIVRRPVAGAGRFRWVLFDFDGTLSLIREGWPRVMLPMMVEILKGLNTGESEAELFRLVEEDVMRLNGKQTIFQMIQFAERVRQRGGAPRDPLEYKHEYHRRLMERVGRRRDGLRSGAIPRDSMLLAGSRALLEDLRRRGLSLCLASGTDEVFVKEEAALLDVARYFEGRIYGAQDDYKAFSKKMVIDRIVAENRIPGQALLAFGDGYVEIENTREVGGYAVGVCSNEKDGRGWDEWKKQRLTRAGADLLIPDYTDLPAITGHLFAS
jgi:phosphoglycolate phosphatase-like HAD superfamily hydrolase